MAEIAQRQETEGTPIPHRFRDASEAVHYARDHKFALYWKGTHAFAKRQSELGEHFVARPVFTRKGPTYVGLVPSTSKRTRAEKNRLNWRGTLLQHLRQIRALRPAPVIPVYGMAFGTTGGNIVEPVGQLGICATI